MESDAPVKSNKPKRRQVEEIIDENGQSSDEEKAKQAVMPLKSKARQAPLQNDHYDDQGENSSEDMDEEEMRIAMEEEKRKLQNEIKEKEQEARDLHDKMENID